MMYLQQVLIKQLYILIASLNWRFFDNYAITWVEFENKDITPRAANKMQ